MEVDGKLQAIGMIVSAGKCFCELDMWNNDLENLIIS